MEKQYLAFIKAHQGLDISDEEISLMFYESFQIGDSRQSAEEGLSLIKSGIKTTTSSLVSDYEDSDRVMPWQGSLSIVLDGQGNPGALIRTVKVEVRAFDEIDAAFAFKYGEWNRTLETWRKQTFDYYSKLCLANGRKFNKSELLLCEEFEMVY